MKWSLYLGKLFGIKTRIHWTFLLLIAWIVLINMRMGASVQQTLMTILFVLAVFVCVVLHELGHALTARRYGIQTRDITLLPIGGLARLEKMPEDPKQELLVAIAGPLVNVAIAILLYPVVFIIGFTPDDAEVTAITARNFIPLLMTINIFLFAFNLIPAFPMDGGRVLRALLSFKMERLKATQIASMLGQFFAIIFAITGLFINPFLILIGIFIFLGARFESEQTQAKEALTGFKVKDAMMRHLPVLRQDETLKNAIDKLLHGQDKEFLVMENGDVHGVLSRDDIIKGLSEKGENTAISEAMKREFDTLNPEMPVEEAFQTMQQKNYTILPVMENGVLKGALDIENIIEFIMIHTAEKRKD